ncbi:NAD-dependent succinate-semialdehyde dehydrogenase [Alloalcanivorax xenomutans]|uniref:NAD-dependent succinate-semialdehyde dehydrogenase n=1 Tax=Alloalcanivorax xenomutans TaxID=1094342 RepID=UPI003A803923
MTDPITSFRALENSALLRQDAYIDGEWIGAAQRFSVTDPATGTELAQVADLAAEATSMAVEAAHRALPAWRDRTSGERAELLKEWFRLVMENRQNLAHLLSLEQGKPLAESLGEIDYGARFLEWFAEEAKRVYGDIIPHDRAGRRLVVLKQPVGVAAAITPWNFPHAMITRKAAPALAAGCTLVLKPDPQTPLSALALAALAEQAGIPAGVFNVVTGRDAAAIGTVLTGDARVRKLSFTGSTPVGKLLMAQSAQHMQKVSLELGGNAPFIIFDDADLDAAVEGALASKFRNSGQTCVCTNRFLVHHRIHDAFCQRFSTSVAALRVGPAFEEGVQQGPLINEDALRKVETHLADAIGKGARVLSGGQRHALGGAFFQPTVLADATPDMLLFQEETFGPLAPVFRFHDEDEALALANDTPFGLAAYVYTRDLGRAWRVGEALEYGMVGVNEGIISNERAPFGGIKESGQGREGSRYGIEDYLEVKYMCLGIG